MKFVKGRLHGDALPHHQLMQRLCHNLDLAPPAAVHSWQRQHDLGELRWAPVDAPDVRISLWRTNLYDRADAGVFLQTSQSVRNVLMKKKGGPNRLTGLHRHWCNAFAACLPFICERREISDRHYAKKD